MIKIRSWPLGLPARAIYQTISGTFCLWARTASFTISELHVPSQLPPPPHAFLFLYHHLLFCDKALVGHKWNSRRFRRKRQTKRAVEMRGCGGWKRWANITPQSQELRRVQRDSSYWCFSIYIPHYRHPSWTTQLRLWRNVVFNSKSQAACKDSRMFQIRVFLMFLSKPWEFSRWAFFLCLV